MLTVIKAGPDAPTANTRNHGQTEKDPRDKLAMIDVRDIADAAVKVHLDPKNAGQTCALTGPVSIMWHTATEAFAAALGRPVKYVAIPPEGVQEAIRKVGWGEWGSGGHAGLQRRVRQGLG